MTTSTDPVELLERAIGYTRGMLAGVRPDLLDRPTPCARWTLADLLDHMSDGLDALTEASRGVIADLAGPDAGTPACSSCATRPATCSAPGPTRTPPRHGSGRARIESTVLLHAGALEMTVHGWDVGQATGLGRPIPEALARALDRSARRLITSDDRPLRFAAAIRRALGSPHPPQSCSPSPAVTLDNRRHSPSPGSPDLNGPLPVEPSE